MDAWIEGWMADHGKSFGGGRHDRGDEFRLKKEVLGILEMPENDRSSWGKNEGNNNKMEENFGTLLDDDGTWVYPVGIG